MQQKIQAFNSMDLIEQIEAIKSIITDTNYLFLVDKNGNLCFCNIKATSKRAETLWH